MADGEPRPEGEADGGRPERRNVPGEAQEEAASPSPSSSPRSSTSGSGAPESGNFVQAIVTHYAEHRMDALLLTTRIITIVLSLVYLLPFSEGQTLFKKVLVANAATCALRLHQRIPRFQLNAEFLQTLLSEDSCHYLFYSIIFLQSYPITMALVPISLFACLHVASSINVILQKTSRLRSSRVGQFTFSLMEKHQKTLLMTVSMSEILLAPLMIFGIFTGVCSIMIPLLFSRFLIFRYNSRRNPYTRTCFRQLRLVAEDTIAKPSCPGFARGALRKGVDLMCRFGASNFVTNQ